NCVWRVGLVWTLPARRTSSQLDSISQLVNIKGNDSHECHTLDTASAVGAAVHLGGWFQTRRACKRSGSAIAAGADGVPRYVLEVHRTVRVVRRVRAGAARHFQNEAALDSARGCGAADHHDRGDRGRAYGWECRSGGEQCRHRVAVGVYCLWPVALEAAGPIMA